jgi:hypothetical protein
MNRLDQLVKDMLEQHEGGNTFFDHLDEAVRQDEAIVDAFIKTFPLNYSIIGSGKFGRFFSNYFSQKRQFDNMIIVVNGNLRKSAYIDDLSYLNLTDKEFIFVDDSFCHGRTRNKVKAEIERNGAVLVASYVIYDGSKNKDDLVHSMYRYHDKH